MEASRDKNNKIGGVKEVEREKRFGYIPLSLDLCERTDLCLFVCIFVCLRMRLSLSLSVRLRVRIYECVRAPVRACVRACVCIVH